jgi:hypothetical protein
MIGGSGNRLAKIARTKSTERDLFEFFLGYLDELILPSTRQGHHRRSINVPAATASFNIAPGIRGTLAMKHR